MKENKKPFVFDEDILRIILAPTDDDKKKLPEGFIPLNEERPIFHSEADFQFALAWKLNEYFKKNDIKNVDIRLEYPFPYVNEEDLRHNRYIDIVLIVKDNENIQKMIPIELKYKTICLFRENLKKKRGESLKPYSYKTEEKFFLRNQSAPDQGAYDSLKDIHRIEGLIYPKGPKEFVIEQGYTIWLTNVPTYWSKGSSMAKHQDFKIYNGRKLEPNKNMVWDEKTAKSTIKGRDGFRLTYDYGEIKWETYSLLNPDDESLVNNKFQYVLTTIPPKESTKNVI